jgi:hypothetical protein
MAQLVVKNLLIFGWFLRVNDAPPVNSRERESRNVGMTRRTEGPYSRTPSVVRHSWRKAFGVLEYGLRPQEFVGVLQSNVSGC